MSKTKIVLNSRLQSNVHSEIKKTSLQLGIDRRNHNTRSTSSVAPWVYNNFVACDKCFAFNPKENSYTASASPYLKNICSECGSRGVRYISTASNKLFEYVYKNIN